MKSCTRILVGFFAPLVIGPAALMASGPYEFHLTDLGITSPLTGSYATGINSSGQVVGYSIDQSMMTSPPSTAFQETSANGLFTDVAANLGSGMGLGINDSGQVSGQFPLSTGGYALRVNPGQSTTSAGVDLGTLGGNASAGESINASGQVAGWADDASNQQLAFRTSSTGSVSDAGTNLGTLAGGNYSGAQGINASGQTVGYSQLTGGFQHAFRTTATGLVSDPSADLGVFAGENNSISFGINASGQAVGFSSNSSMIAPISPHAFRTTPTGLVSDPGTDLGTLPGDTESVAYAINDAGWVVGFSGSHAMLQDGTTMYDLGSLLDSSGTGWTLQPMDGINNSDQIVGYAIDTADSSIHAVRLDPVSVPEPGSLAVVAGVVMLNLRRGRKFRA